MIKRILIRTYSIVKDYYYILGVADSALDKEIRSAYRKLSLKFHPDKNDGEKFFEERFKEIQEAYATLSNPEKRENYNSELNLFKSSRTNWDNHKNTEEELKRKYDEEYKRKEAATKRKYDEAEQKLKAEFAKKNANKKKTRHPITLTLISLSISMIFFLFFTSDDNRNTFLEIIKNTTQGSNIQTYEKKNIYYEDSLKLKENDLRKREDAVKEKELQENKKETSVPISEIYKQVKSGVFIIYTQGSDSISQGTGFFISDSGIAISNFHVFEDADKAIVILDNGAECLISRLIDSNKDLDYVIFQVEKKMNTCYPLKIATEMPEIGSTCFTIGNPKGLTQTLSIGNISGYRNQDNLIQTTTEITHGSSGGPLFNTSGQVIGITSKGFGEANLNFALNISKVPYQAYVSSNETPIIDKKLIPNALIKSTIEKYYATIFNKDYSTLYDLYTPSIDRYYNDFNILQSQAVENAKDYWTKFKIISASNMINWETLNVTPSSDETFYVTFNMEYYIQREEIKKIKTFNLDIIMTVTKNMKIKSIYENIIKYPQSASGEQPNFLKVEEFYICISQADARYSNKDFRGAIISYTKALEIKPDYAAAYYRRGNAKNELEFYVEAINDFNKAIEINPKLALAYLSRGYAKSQLLLFSKAIEDYTVAIKIGPKMAEAHYWRANAISMLQDYKASQFRDYTIALTDYSFAIDIDPKNPNYYYYRGQVRIRSGNKDFACADFKSALDLGKTEAYEMIKKYCQ